MNEDRRRVIMELFEAAAELPPEERRAFLESRDPSVAQEVLALLEGFEAAPDTAAPRRVAAPEKIGRYSGLRPLGRGGMGEVYAARDTELDRSVALKFLSGHALAGSSVARLMREARAASALNHPYIVTVHEVIESGTGLVIVMELVEGVALRELTGQPRPVEEVLRIGRQIAEALAAAHASGIVHRDIKPENVMVRRDGYVKLLDFGLARRTDAGQTSTASLPAGTLRYMSPEQARGEKVGAATDVFSLGIVLYELAAGRHPFPGESAFDTVHEMLTKAPASPANFAPQVPSELAALILAMLAKNPADRPPAQAIAEELQAIAQAQPSGPVRRWLPRPRRGRRSLWIVLAVLALGLAAYRWTGLREAGSPAPALRVIPVTTLPGAKDFPCFSPDGSQIAYSWDGNSGSEKRDIYIRVIGTGDPLRLTRSSEDDILPAWSPDGRHIAFCRRFDGGREPAVYLVPALGGPERKIADGDVGVSWSPDGKTLALVQDGIVLHSVETGSQVRITNPEPYSDSLPVFSPDGEWIAFTRSFARSSRELFVVSARGGTPRQLTFDKRPTWGLAWTADGREIVFSSNRGDSGETLWRIPAAGGTPSRVSVSSRAAFFPSISRQGDRLAFTEAFVDFNIYRYQGRGFGAGIAPGPLGEPELLVPSSREESSPAFSPDGERFAFVSSRSGSHEIWVGDKTGRNLSQVTFSGGAATGSPQWSPDGRSIIFDSRPAGNSDLFLIPAAGGAPRQLTSDPSDEMVPTWSGDGEWIYFISNRTGSDQAWKMPAAGGSAVQVTRNGAREARPSPDGKLAYFIRWHTPGIWSAPAGGGPEELVPGLEGAHKSRSWGVLEQGIYFVSGDGPPYAVQFYSFGTGTITRLATLDKEPFWNAPLLALSPDGRTLLYTRRDHDVNDITVIDGFR